MPAAAAAAAARCRELGSGLELSSGKKRVGVVEKMRCVCVVGSVSRRWERLRPKKVGRCIFGVAVWDLSSSEKIELGIGDGSFGVENLCGW